ncbi:hypothetical protein BJY04DRAFT_117977 [Aspergillus karnatakaensis]|uniref:uncharacterized protein n=1 Tax=Aspergillus karnatakaensis TaxID=1810916 RepID=UPI003CCDAD9F
MRRTPLVLSPDLVLTSIDSFLSEEYKKEHARGYKSNFQEEFWPVLLDDINGSFHCEYSFPPSSTKANTNLSAKPAVSWSCFKIKEVKAANDYTWKQPVVHVNWDPRTGRQLVHIFELSLSQRKNLIDKLATHAERKVNPFNWHASFAHIILEQYDHAFWMLRNLVRNQEKERSKPKHKEDKFPLLHDISRHVFHYQEIIEVAEHTLQSLTKEFIRWRRDDADGVQANIQTFVKTRQLISYEEKRAHSLKTRSKSLNDRHQNEINLAFNLVSQGFGHDARSDSNMMKTIAVVSMVYLPGTFVSGLFGTNFFSFQADPGNTWLTADEFWIYWAVTIPLTMATMGVWAIWHWREKYPLWWQKVFERRGSSQEPAGSKVAVTSGSNGIARASSNLLRMFTPQRLDDMQRQETV